jgi:hypothetical protein
MLGIRKEGTVEDRREAPRGSVQVVVHILEEDHIEPRLVLMLLQAQVCIW